MIFREYQPVDIDAIAELEKRAFTVGPYTKPMLKRIFEKQNSFNVVAEDEGRIAGYVIAIPLDETSADVESIAVDPDYQRTGLGSHLLTRIEGQMKGRGFEKSVLEVRDRNTEAISFYSKHNYIVISYMPRYYKENFRGTRGAFRMVKNLRN